MACIIDSCVPTASMTLCAPRPWVRSLILATPSSAAFGNDVGGTELAGQLLSLLVVGERDDPFGAQVLGGEHAEQADRAGTDGGGGVCRAARRRRRRRTSRCPARPRRSAATASDRRRGLGSSDEGAVSQWDAYVLGLGAVGTDELTVDAVGLVTGLADLAGVVGGE